MTHDKLAEVATGLLGQLSRHLHRTQARPITAVRDGAQEFAKSDDPKALWQETLAWLVENTGATGAWFKLLDPTPLTLSVGKLAMVSLAYAQAWIEDPEFPSDTGFQVYRSAEATTLCLLVKDESRLAVSPGELYKLSELDRPAGYLILDFPAGEDLAVDACAQLQAAIQVLVTVSRQASALQQSQNQLSRFRHLYEVGQVISSTLDLDQVLKQSAERVTEVLRAEASTIMLVDEVRGELIFKIPAGPAEQILREQRMPIDKGVAGWVATHGEPLIIPDVGQDSRFYAQIDELSGFRTRSIMAVPLQAKGKTIGIAEVINKVSGGSFTPEDQQWLSIFAPLIAAAIENARLFTALREEHDRIITAEEKVRHELARDLHDGPAQVLSAIILDIDVARRQLALRPEKTITELNYLESLAQQANQEVRGLLFGLRPLALETHGLTAALTQLVERIRHHAPFQLSLDYSSLPAGIIDPRVSSTLFVIVQEALNNVTRHANAHHVFVRLGASEKELWVEVEDDGRGFDVKQTDAQYSQRGSFGLLNMRERARLIDGRTEITSPRPGHTTGTQVRVEVPLARARAAR
jgi:signal transduction histidine kinase